jgi:uncharacterized protein involved in copper resistance
MCVSLLASAITLTACGGKETMASKSAVAYRQAQANGTPVTGGHEHGGHAAASTADTPATIGMSDMDHATMTGMDHSTMTGTDHSTMAGMDHSKTTAADHSGMAGMDHSKMTAADHSGMAGMDHSTAADHSGMTGMDHSAMQHGAPSAPAAVVTSAPRSSAEMARIDPAATLRPDAFDAPAGASVAEAEKAVGGNAHAGHSMGAGETANPAAVVYTCPMHPEVKSATPGTCPKCGMTLVPAAPKKEK